MQSLTQFIESKHNFLIKGHTKSQHNELVDNYYIVLCYDDKFDSIVNKSSAYMCYLDANPDTPSANPAAFIMNKEQIHKYKQYVDDIFNIPGNYNMDTVEDLQNDWYDNKIKVDDLKYTPKLK